MLRAAPEQQRPAREGAQRGEASPAAENVAGEAAKGVKRSHLGWHGSIWTAKLPSDSPAESSRALGSSTTSLLPAPGLSSTKKRAARRLLVTMEGSEGT